LSKGLKASLELHLTMATPENRPVVFKPEIDLGPCDRRPEYIPQHAEAAKWRGKPRFRCKGCNAVFLRPSGDSRGYSCPGCGKWPRVNCHGRPIDVPEPNPAKDARVGELVVLW
jgi:hypothetical protein